MKSTLCLLLFLFASSSFAQVSSKIMPDDMGKETLKLIYKDFKKALYAEVLEGNIHLHTTTSLNTPLEDETLSNFFKIEEATILPIDPWGVDWVDTLIVYEIDPNQWESVRFEKDYFTITVAENRIGYLANKDLKKLNPMHVALLERFQFLLNPSVINDEFIQLSGNSLFDSLQAKIFALIESGKIKIYSTENPNIQLNTQQFDTLFDQEEIYVVEDFETGEFGEEMVIDRFSHSHVKGMAIRYTLEEQKNGWELNYRHIGFCSQPMASQGINTNLIIVWMDWKDVRSNMDELDWFLFKEIISQTSFKQDQQELQFDHF